MHLPAPFTVWKGKLASIQLCMQRLSLFICYFFAKIPPKGSVSLDEARNRPSRMREGHIIALLIIVLLFCLQPHNPHYCHLLVVEFNSFNLHFNISKNEIKTVPHHSKHMTLRVFYLFFGLDRFLIINSNIEVQRN